MLIFLLFCCLGPIFASQVQSNLLINAPESADIDIVGTTLQPECDCGEGSVSCSFSDVTGRKVCECEDGYAFDSRDITNKCFYCKNWCNENAKTCAISSDGVVSCVCKEGFKVENINYQCKECDCGSKGNCTFNYNAFKVCKCDKGFAEKNGKCVACDCGPKTASCYYSENYGKKCECENGYMLKLDTCERCDCGPGQYYCYFDSKNGSKLCTCSSKKYFLRNDMCEECDCQLDVNCEYVNNTKRCFCPDGFENKDEQCKDINECLNPLACQSNSRCVNTNGSYECYCEKGYASKYGDDMIKSRGCEDIDECTSLQVPCGVDLLCGNQPGSYECHCRTGYVPDKIYEDPKQNTCKKASNQSGWRTATIITGIALSGCIVVFAAMAVIRHRRRTSF